MARGKAIAKSIGETEESADLEKRVQQLEESVKLIAKVINGNVEKANKRHKELAEKVESNNALVWTKLTEMELGVQKKAAETEKELGIE